MRIDAHQHFWIYKAEDYPWMTERLRSIRRDLLPADLELELAKFNIDRCIAVQARQSLEESRWLLDLADSAPRIHGVVGWVDLRAPDVEVQLDDYAGHPKFRGVRHVVQDEPDDNFMLHPAFLRGLSKLKQYGLAYDLLVFPRQLPAAIEVARQLPLQRFVLDHIAKPNVTERTVSPWREQIHELAGSGNVWCKVSGLITEANWSHWQPLDFRPYLDVVFEAFGENRVMYGSDWPVCLLAGSYEAVYGLAEDYVRQMSESARQKFWGKNAEECYART